MQASAAVGSGAMLVVAGASEAGDDLAVHVTPNHPQHSPLAASAQLPPAHPDRWRVLTVISGESGLGMVFHHGQLDPLEFHKAHTPPSLPPSHSSSRIAKVCIRVFPSPFPIFILSGFPDS